MKRSFYNKSTALKDAIKIFSFMLKTKSAIKDIAIKELFVNGRITQRTYYFSCPLCEYVYRNYDDFDCKYCPWTFYGPRDGFPIRWSKCLHKDSPFMILMESFDNSLNLKSTKQRRMVKNLTKYLITLYRKEKKKGFDNEN